MPIPPQTAVPPVRTPTVPSLTGTAPTTTLALLALAVTVTGVLLGGAASAAPRPAGQRIPADPVPLGAPAWTAPLRGRLSVTRPFDPPATRFGPGHRGVDLAATPGAPILAAGDGIVAFAGLVAGRPVLSIDHADGLRTTYEPVTASVSAGRRVARGSPVGFLVGGHPGCPAPACLHWGLRRGHTYLDPLLLLRPPHLRLLPGNTVSLPTTSALVAFP